LKPQSFRDQFVVMEDTTYRVLEDDGRGGLPKVAMLPVGRVLWLKEAQGDDLPDGQARAYAENIGVISVRRAALAKAGTRRTDGYRHFAASGSGVADADVGSS
jgi:hypothetical protein